MGIFDGLSSMISTLGTNAMNSQLTQQAWQRDDNAVQRRAADMAKAGFNPVLAAGAAAQNASPIPMRTPDPTGFDPSSMIALISQKQDISRSVQQTALDKAQADRINLQNEIDRYDFEYYKTKGLPTNVSGPGKMGAALVGAAQTLAGKVNDQGPVDAQGVSEGTKWRRAHPFLGSFSNWARGRGWQNQE